MSKKKNTIRFQNLAPGGCQTFIKFSHRGDKICLVGFETAFKSKLTFVSKPSYNLGRVKQLWLCCSLAAHGRLRPLAARL